MKWLKVVTNLQEICKKLFSSCSTVSVTPSINTHESSNDLIVLIISFIYSFEIKKNYAFSSLRAPFPLIFLLNLLTAFEVKLLTNPGKLFLAKGIATFAIAFFPKFANQEPKDPTDWMILDIWALLSFLLKNH